MTEADHEFASPDITRRKNAGLSHAADWTLAQPCERYGEADAVVWATLLARQRALLPGRACDEFLAGLDALDLPADRVPEFAVINDRLAAATGWRIVAVPGLIPDLAFFAHLAERRFPVTWWLREPAQLDYLPEPDLFHDLFGHVPLLTNPVFADYLQAYGRGGLKASHLHALPMLARLYWYTVEFGLIDTPAGLRIYGAGILSSRGECRDCLDSPTPQRIGFDVRRIMRQLYHIDRYQDTYFVIDDFVQLFDATAPDFTPYYAELAALPELAPGALLADDRRRHLKEAGMTDLFDNPMGLCGFEFVEFASPAPDVIEPLLEKLGFSLVARHRSKDVLLYRQGGINFIVNREASGVPAWFAAEHGPSACGLAFRVRDAHLAYERALALGAQPIDMPTGPMELRLPAIKGIGGAPLYLIDRFEEGQAIYDIDFRFLEGVDRHPVGHGFTTIDHLTHNVYRGRMNYWADFYARLFNFREIRYFDIKGEYTGLTSRAMTAPDGKIRIPLNEEASRGTGQIEEFLMAFNGEGIQHIALLTDDLPASIDALRAAGVPLMTAPKDTYYEMLAERLPGHGENVEALRARGILLDGSVADAGAGRPARLLLQIFSETLLGPVFFEFIQRKGDDGFGEGNFKALFESLERDQLRRGVLSPEAR